MLHHVETTILLARLPRHDQSIDRQTIDHGGQPFQIAGIKGAAFDSALDALAAALAIQTDASQKEPRAQGESDESVPRIALHSGDIDPAALEQSALFQRARAILAATQRAQILLSASAAAQLQDRLPPRIELYDWGRHRLNDLTKPERLFQITDAERDPGPAPQRTPRTPPSSLDTRPTNLPAQPTSLIGREPTIEAALASFRRSDVRLLTLTGPGGTGKTRLSLHIAARLLEEFPDGVWFIDLAPVGEAGLVLHAIAQALNVKDSGTEAPIDRLATALREKVMLLVLDNFEHVVNAAGGVADLLSRVPALHLIVTSRERLHITAEHEFAVPPLGMPNPDDQQSLAALAQSEAVRLFVERAQAVQKDFSLTSENAPVIAAICQRLDGLPLAIELAAARSKLFPPSALLARLGNRMNFLTGGLRDLPDRQQTLRRAIAWSYDLLTPAEQALFRRLAVFVGGWDIEAIEAVCADTPLAGFEPRPFELDSDPCLEALNSLLDKSLVRQTETDGDEPRFTMLQTIRDFALEQLRDVGETALTQHRHSVYYTALAERGEPHLRSAEQHAWIARLEDEHDNFRDAMGWSLHHDLDLAARLAGALWRFWMVRGYFSEGRRWLTAALAHRSSLSEERLALLLLGEGALAQIQGNVLYSAAVLAESLSLWERTTNDLGMALALNALANAERMKGNYDRAQELYSDSLELWQARNEYDRAKEYYQRAGVLQRQIGYSWQLALSLNNLGEIASDEGDFALAKAYHEESLELRRAIGDRWGIAASLLNLANVARIRNTLDEAENLLTQAAILVKELEDVGQQTVYSLIRGDIALARGKFAEARRSFEETLAISEREGDKLNQAQSRAKLATIAILQGRDDEADAPLGESLAIFQQISNKRGVALVLENYAALASARGETARAIALCSAATAMHQRIGSARVAFDQNLYNNLMLTLRAESDPADFAAAWAYGETAATEDVLDWQPDLAAAAEPADADPAASETPPAGDSAERSSTPPGHFGLSEREIEVLQRLAQGMTNTEIAASLLLSRFTINAHLRSIYGKLGVSTRTAAARYAIEHNLV